MHLRYLFLLAVLLVGCRPDIGTPESRCYAMRWTDTTWAGLLPDSIRLAAGQDSARMAGAKGPFPIMPPRPADSANRPWRELIRAQWYAVGPDTIQLGFSTDHADWGAPLSVNGDTIKGRIFFSGLAADGSIASAVTGVRIRCPDASGRNAGA